MSFSYLGQVKLDKLMELTRGIPEIKLGLIDGPIALGHSDLVNTRIHEVPGNSVTCTNGSSQACSHGTFVAGMLGGRGGTPAPSISPDCTILARPIFSEKTEPTSSTPKELAQAILDCIHSGARAINMSVALTYRSTGLKELKEALDYSAKRGVIIVAAAGNGGELASSVITSHPWVLSVVACDFQGRFMDQSNLGGRIGRWGLMAPGDRIQSLKPSGGYIAMSGTSVATPFVTGTIGLLWSLFPEASPTLIRSALLQNCRNRRSLIPPLLDAWGAYRFLVNNLNSSKMVVKRGKIMDQNEIKEERTTEVAQLPATTSVPAQYEGPSVVVPQICGTCPKAIENAIGNGGSVATYVYAMGRIEPRFPTRGIEKEFAQVVSRSDAKGLTDLQTTQSVLSKKENRYLARKICWVMAVEGLETYILKPRDPGDLGMLPETIRQASNRNDLDVVIGVKGSIAPPEMCNGLQVPILFFDQIYSFDVESLIKSLPRPEKKTAEEFEPAATELFERIMQMTDNAGATDEYRALNYLAVRYPAIYTTAAQEFDRNCSLTGIEVLSSRLSGVRKILDVVFSYTDRGTDVSEKFFVRVDVTEEFPFLVTKMSPYYDR